MFITYGKCISLDLEIPIDVGIGHPLMKEKVS